MDAVTSQAVAATVAGVGLGVPSVYFSPWIWRQYRMSCVRQRLARNRVLALTYDDGPSETLTPQLLDLLRQRNAHATFFMLGRSAEQHPKIADRIIEEGHQVGCHSYQHVNAWKVWPRKALADIKTGYERLSPWVQADGMFRPPHGKMTLPTFWSIRRRGAPVWWWTIDSQDTWNTLPASIHIADRLRKDGGGIVLMHDLDRGSQRNNFVLEVTDALLTTARNESMKVITLRGL